MTTASKTSTFHTIGETLQQWLCGIFLLFTVIFTLTLILEGVLNPNINISVIYILFGGSWVCFLSYLILAISHSQNGQVTE
jgi:hypothetical protein